MKKALFGFLCFTLSSLSASAAEAVNYDCTPVDPTLALRVQVVTRFPPGLGYGVKAIVVKGLAGGQIFETPVQIESSLDPDFTSTPFPIEEDAVEEMGSVIVGKGGTYLYLSAPSDDEEIEEEYPEIRFPTSLNSPKVKGGKTIPMSCARKTVG